MTNNNSRFLRFISRPGAALVLTMPVTPTVSLAANSAERVSSRKQAARDQAASKPLADSIRIEIDSQATEASAQDLESVIGLAISQSYYRGSLIANAFKMAGARASNCARAIGNAGLALLRRGVVRGTAATGDGRFGGNLRADGTDFSMPDISIGCGFANYAR